MKYIMKLFSRKLGLLILLAGFGVGVLNAQNDNSNPAISYEEKVKDLSEHSEVAAQGFERLVDGAPDAVFFVKEQNELLPREHMRKDGAVSVLYADSYDQILSLVKMFPQHMNTIQLIRIKWDGQPVMEWKDREELMKYFSAMESLEYFVIQKENPAPAEMKNHSSDLKGEADHLQNLLHQYEMQDKIEIIYRTLQPAQ